MIRPTNRTIPFDFGPLLGPLAEPSGNPPPPDDPFGGRDLFAPEDPNKKHPFDGPIKPKPNPFKDYPWPDEDIRVQDPKDKVPIELTRCNPDDFVVIVTGPYEDKGWYQTKDTDRWPPFSSGMAFLGNWENRKRYFLPMLNLNEDTRGGFSFNGASDFGRLESIEFYANGKWYHIKVNAGSVKIYSEQNGLRN